MVNKDSFAVATCPAETVIKGDNVEVDEGLSEDGYQSSHVMVEEDISVDEECYTEEEESSNTVEQGLIQEDCGSSEGVERSCLVYDTNEGCASAPDAVEEVCTSTEDNGHIVEDTTTFSIIHQWLRDEDLPIVGVVESYEDAEYISEDVVDGGIMD